MLSAYSVDLVFLSSAESFEYSNTILIDNHCAVVLQPQGVHTVVSFCSTINTESVDSVSGNRDLTGTPHLAAVLCDTFMETRF